MSGLDRYIVAEELKQKGWTDAPDGKLKPPETLVMELRIGTFDVYDAECLQGIITRSEHYAHG